MMRTDARSANGSEAPQSSNAGTANSSRFHRRKNPSAAAAAKNAQAASRTVTPAGTVCRSKTHKPPNASAGKPANPSRPSRTPGNSRLHKTERTTCRRGQNMAAARRNSTAVSSVCKQAAVDTTGKQSAAAGKTRPRRPTRTAAPAASAQHSQPNKSTAQPRNRHKRQSRRACCFTDFILITRI